jgi:hypothetical protein
LRNRTKMFHVKHFGTIDGRANIHAQDARFVFWADSFIRFDKSRLGKGSVNATRLRSPSGRKIQHLKKSERVDASHSKSHTNVWNSSVRADRCRL